MNVAVLQQWSMVGYIGAGKVNKLGKRAAGLVSNRGAGDDQSAAALYYMG